MSTEAAAEGGNLPAVVADILDGELPDGDTFPREYVEKLRHEAASYRNEFKPYRDVFKDVSPELRDYILYDVAGPLVSADPTTALDELYELVERVHTVKGDQPRWAQQIAEHTGEAAPAASPVAPAKPAESSDDPVLTVSQWRALQEEDRRKEEEANGINSIFAKAEELGYHKEGEFGDDMAALLYLSTHVTKGDMEAAHALRASRYQAALDAAVEAKLEELRSGAAKWPSVSVSTAGTPAPTGDEPKTFEEANARARKRLDKFFGV